MSQSLPQLPKLRGKKRRRANRREYDPAVDPLLARWAAQRHLAIDEAAKRVGVPASQLRRWIKDHPEMAAAINAGERNADAQVVDALYKRCLGVEFDDDHISRVGEDKDHNPVHIRKIKRRRPPDTQAILFWLKNRLPDQWSDKPTTLTTKEIIARVRTIPALPPKPQDKNSGI